MLTYYEMLSIGGVRRLVRKELRQMDSGFYGVAIGHWAYQAKKNK
jgi:hypothetical protein